MDEEGIDKFFSDMGVNSESDIVTILASKYMNAASMGTYTHEEFKTGCKELEVDSIQAWQNRGLPRLY
eukprot:CAMPEP_0116886482 /NCGR_PEP_ID=MMETSP0463-20121206/20365_1 /TAXON_ID=181622 /ORGANISM="Strombidinopsis sp, Strain SopsisLIS2011" /LENGTH=67 /DNA_ID=CAMNT_0004547013 /DNA_START=205 /DNA_END=408 /DNA_ORIENTATION=+